MKQLKKSNLLLVLVKSEPSRNVFEQTVTTTTVKYKVIKSVIPIIKYLGAHSHLSGGKEYI